MGWNANVNGNHVGIVRKKFVVEYQAIYNSFTIKPSAVIAAAQNTMVKALVNSGVWVKLDVFHLYAGHTNANGESLINWINPGTSNATAVNSPVFTSLEGFLGDGVSTYINTNYASSTDAINYTQNSASYGVYSRTDIDENVVSIGLNDTTHDSNLQLRATNLAKIRINTGANSTVANTNSLGFYIANRVLSTHQEMWKNKVRIINAAQASSGMPTIDFYVLAWNNMSVPGLFANKQISMGFCGGGLTQSNIENLTDAFETYMDSNGKGVIP